MTMMSELHLVTPSSGLVTCVRATALRKMFWVAFSEMSVVCIQTTILRPQKNLQVYTVAIKNKKVMNNSSQNASYL